MHTQQRWPMFRIHCIPHNERGVVLVVGLMIFVALTLLGMTAVMTTTADLKIGVNYRHSTEAFYLAEAGAEQGRQQLRALNARSANTNSFTDELAAVRGANGVLNGYEAGTDDVPLIHPTNLGNGSYTVYLTNDASDGPLHVNDTNRRATLISVATISNGTREASQAIIETTVAMFQLFPLPATITLLGKGASFTGNSSGAKELHGDDQCGAEPPKPVVAVSDPVDVHNLRHSIDGSQPGTYHTKNALTGADETASDHSAHISRSIPTSQLNDINHTFGLNLLDPVALTGLVATLQAQADTVCAGASCGRVDVGTPANPQLVVAQGDFTLGSSGGAGILVVTGTLTLNGYVDYRGLILVIGDGVMQRHGGGHGTITGGIVVANTRGPDNIRNTLDDTTALGPPRLDTAGAGRSDINYCSTALSDAYSKRPLRIISWRPRYGRPKG